MMASICLGNVENLKPFPNPIRIGTNSNAMMRQERLEACVISALSLSIPTLPI